MWNMTKTYRDITEFALDGEGFSLISSTSLDLLLLDVMMPSMDGSTTLLKLREFNHLGETPAIFMAAKV